MNCFACEESLEYTAPSHGDWGLVRILCLIPETHVLFVCPSACGRHSALGALAQNIKHKVSYYFLDAEEIARGYDEQIKAAARELLLRLHKRPKVMTVVVSCLDDLIGTDVDKVMEELSEEIRDVHFGAGHMNPITLNTATPPIVSNFATMLSYLRSSPKKKDEVNLLSPFFSARRTGELFVFLHSMGIEKVKQIQENNTFEEFQAMGESRWNIALSPVMEYGVKKLQKEGIKHISAYPVFHPDGVEKMYSELAMFFQEDLGRRSIPEFSAEKKSAWEAIRKARRVIGEMPIRITQGSVSRPFHLAKSLQDLGFKVESVVAQAVPPFEQKSMEKAAQSGCKFIQTQHFRTMLFENVNKDVLAIGYDGAYMAQTSHIVNFMHDEACFGYEGIQFLMDRMVYAATHEQDLEEMIRQEGLVI